MPLYTDVVIAARATVEKMCAHRDQIPGHIELDIGGGEGASMERQGNTLTLHLPTWAPDKELSRAEADRLVGYLVHEIAHWLHTNWSQWEAAAREGGFIKSMTNALEDLRIERVEQGLGVWRGFGAAMSVLVNHMDREGQSKPRAQPLGAVAADLPWLVALVGRAECNGLDIPGAARAKAGVHPKLRNVLAAALREAGQTQSCADCHKLARKLARMVQEAKEQEQEQEQEQKQEQAPQKAQGSPQAGQTPEPGQDSQDTPDSPQAQTEGEGAGEGAGEGEGQGQGEGQGEGEGRGEGRGEGQSEGRGEGQSEGEGEGEGEGASLGSGGDDWATLGAGEDTIDPTLKADVQHEKAQGLAGYLAGLPGFAVKPSPWGLAMPGTAKARRDALPRSALLHDQVGQLVAAQEVRQMERRLTAGRFDRRAVARAAMGSLDVCAHRHVTPGCNTAVCLLLDLSGSMNGSKIAAAQTMAMHLSEAVDMAGGKSAVLGFGDPAHSHMTRTQAHGCRLLVFKDWHETPALGAQRIALAQTPFGTPLSPSIIAAARWMRGSVEADRYVLGALTDGGCAYGAEATQAACRTAVRLGVDFFGLGCQEDTSQAFRGFPRADVWNVRDLPRVAMRTLLRELEA